MRLEHFFVYVCVFELVGRLAFEVETLDRLISPTREVPEWRGVIIVATQRRSRV
jgi:hypothetical protein